MDSSDSEFKTPNINVKVSGSNPAMDLCFAPTCSLPVIPPTCPKNNLKKAHQTSPVEKLKCWQQSFLRNTNLFKSILETILARLTIHTYRISYNMFILHVYDSTVLLGSGGDGDGIKLGQKGRRAGDCICICKSEAT